MSGINDIFAKRKAKKGTKKFGVNLNKIDDNSSAQKEEEKNVKATNESVTFEDNSIKNDSGWVEDVQKKKVVHTGGKQVSEFINMDDLRTVDDVVAERVYMEERKKEFAESRSVAMKKDGESIESSAKGSSEKNKVEAPAASAGIWVPKSIQKKIGVDAESEEAFPSLGNSKKATAKNTKNFGVWGSKPIHLASGDEGQPKGNLDKKIEKISVVDWKEVEDASTPDSPNEKQNAEGISDGKEIEKIMEEKVEEKAVAVEGKIEVEKVEEKTVVVEGEVEEEKVEERTIVGEGKVEEEEEVSALEMLKKKKKKKKPKSES